MTTTTMRMMMMMMVMMMMLTTTTTMVMMMMMMMMMMMTTMNGNKYKHGIMKSVSCKSPGVAHVSPTSPPPDWSVERNWVE